MLARPRPHSLSRGTPHFLFLLSFLPRISQQDGEFSATTLMRSWRAYSHGEFEPEVTTLAVYSVFMGPTSISTCYIEFACLLHKATVIYSVSAELEGLGSSRNTP